MNKSTMNRFVMIFVMLVFFCFLGNLITNNKIFSGIQYLCLGLMFLFQYFINKDNIQNKLATMQLIAGILMMSIGTIEVITNVAKIL